MAIKKPNDTDTTGNYVTPQMSKKLFVALLKYPHWAKKFDKEASQY
tara:strand:- start:877 stop:1014 length:138 start_codon:yes stop_codon:yes gene_type:complete